ncbi:sensor histidine kinase [Qipengyuania sp.]|uniref:sensor histidine kinase n=1 Tax=Qipengyuania sp. TaxID=2004515 RepID=UPI0035C7E3CE
MATASTIPPTSRAPEADAPKGDDAGLDRGVGADGGPVTAIPRPGRFGARRSLAGRMMAIAAAWIAILLLAGGFALDRTLTNLVERNFDDQLNYMLTAMISSAEIDPFGDVYFNRQLGDQRFLEPNSGLYWQISGKGREDYPSRSLWDRSLEVDGDHQDDDIHIHDSNQFPGEPLRVAERSVYLPGSDTQWWFVVAASREELDYQIARIRSILVWSFAVLGLGLFAMAVLQNWIGLGPLRRVRAAIQDMRRTGASRIDEPLPFEVQPLVEEVNALLAHTDRQAAEARTHAGNLAHALKTPLTVLTNAATAHAADLEATVMRESRTMQRHVDHHLARARAVGRRAAGHSRTPVRESAEAVRRAVERLYPETRFDIAGGKTAVVAIERQDLDEILGNLVENAAKYGGGSVFVTIDAEPGGDLCTVWVEDDGPGIPEREHARIFDRGARLDTGKPGTGLGLAIVRDVAAIYGGDVTLGESEDLGGLLVRLQLPRR